MITNHNSEELNNTGIYRILCIITNKSYIGLASSVNNNRIDRKGFNGRYYSHKLKLSNNTHVNKYLQNAYNKYGSKNFIFEILEICESSKCEEREIYYIDEYNSMYNLNGFNIIRQSLSNKHAFTKEHCEKISNTLKGVKRPLEIVKKWSNPVEQYDLEDNFINSYYSISEASRVTGIQRQDIGQAIIGKKCKTAGGYKWKKIKT